MKCVGRHECNGMKITQQNFTKEEALDGNDKVDFNEETEIKMKEPLSNRRTEKDLKHRNPSELIEHM